MPASVYHSLRTVEGLKKGRTRATEPEPVLPVENTLVEATLPHLPHVVADMVRFQRLTGCRPGEVCQLRPCDVGRSGDVWEYRPADHKTAYRGRERIIYIGPRAQQVSCLICCGMPMPIASPRLRARRSVTSKCGRNARPTYNPANYTAGRPGRSGRPRPPTRKTPISGRSNGPS